MPGLSGIHLRRWWFQRTLARLGPGAALGPGLLVLGAKRIEVGSHFSTWRGCTLAACSDGTVTIGDHVSFNAHVYVNACYGGRITIGSDVLIGPNVVLRSSDHRTTDMGTKIRLQGHVPGEIVVEDDVWLSANVTVVGGVRIGRGAVVGANAVVTSDVAPNTIVGGVPARVIGRRGVKTDE
jgi:galactoside O-acetyltransferase